MGQCGSTSPETPGKLVSSMALTLSALELEPSRLHSHHVSQHQQSLHCTSSAAQTQPGQALGLLVRLDSMYYYTSI